MTIMVCTAINLGVSALISFIVLRIYKQHYNLGWQEVGFKVRVIRTHHCWRPNLYCMDIFFKGSVCFMVISRKDYKKLSQNGSERIMVYARGFYKSRLNPILDRFEFSLKEVDWDRRDRNGCLKGLFIVFIMFEYLTYLLAFQSKAFV